MLNSIFSPWPNFSDEEAALVSEVLLSNKVNYRSGEEGKYFEKEFATFAGTNHAVALANGTVALDLALAGLEIGSHNGGGSKDEVVVTPRTFLASVSSVVNAGAIPVFADVDAESQNITPSTVEPVITANTKAIICVHLAGWPSDMDGFKSLVGGRSIKLIEDCAQAHGALYKDEPVGGLGDVGAWSFCQDKIMTTGGEGGMVTCNDTDLYKRMWSYKDHGKDYDKDQVLPKTPGFNWVHDSFGTNWRMTEMQSALGRFQLKMMPEWTATRNKNATDLMKTLRPWSGNDGFLRVPDFSCSTCNGSCIGNKVCRHAWYKFSAFIRPDRMPNGLSRDQLIAELNEQGLPCMQGSCSEVYLESAFDNTPFRPAKRLPVAKELGETSLMFLVHPGVHKVDIDLD